MAGFREALPQLDGQLFLTDAGLETDLIFNHGVEIREFAAHTLLSSLRGREALRFYYEGFLQLAEELGAGFVLDAPTWKAHSHWGESLGEDSRALRQANLDSVGFIAEMRDRHAGSGLPIVLNANIGPRGDAYRPEVRISRDVAQIYFAEQMGWLAGTQVDMVSALTFNQASEAAGFAEAAKAAGLPAVVSFTVETDGHLPDGTSLADAISEVDAASGEYPAYYMINCAHPDHFADALTIGEKWTRRIRGLRANASRLSHAELDEAPELDDGNPEELAGQYRELASRMPWLNVFGGCCGTDLRHVNAIARTLWNGDNRP